MTHENTNIFNVYNIECIIVCEFKMAMSQNVIDREEKSYSIFVFFNTIYYSKNGPVTVTKQIISTPNFIALFYFKLK